VVDDGVADVLIDAQNAELSDDDYDEDDDDDDDESDEDYCNSDYDYAETGAPCKLPRTTTAGDRTLIL